MNSSKRNAFILLAILLAGAIAYIYPKMSFNVKTLRFPDIVSSPDFNAKVITGILLPIVLNEEKLSKVDSIVIAINGSRKTVLNDSYKYEVDTKNLPLGSHKLDISVYKGGEKKVVDMPFLVVSDVAPLPMTYTKIATLPHDKKAYTQGMEVAGGILYESGGQYGESLIRKVNPKNGAVIKSVDLTKDVFAEGLTLLNGKIYQITWKEGVCFVYDQELNQLKKTGFRSSNGEGWGICNDGKSLIISDGTNKLTYIHPETMAVEKVLSVYAGSNEVSYINELEYVDGYIYANIYTTNQVAKIDAANGKVLGVIELDALKNENPDGEVLNGIAYLPASKTFLISGKYWSKMYELKFN